MIKMRMVKISMVGESMDSINEINELMDLHVSYGSFKEVDSELIENESLNDLLDAYEYETDIFAFETMDVERFKNSLEYLEICEVI